MSGIVDLIVAGKELGIFQFYLPFIILFAILYGLLNKSKIFGEKAKAINVIISLAFSFFVMEYALAAPLEEFFAQFAGTTMAVLVGILGFLMVTYLLLAVVGGKFPEPGKYVKYVVLIGIILAVGAYISSGGAVIFPGISLRPVTELPAASGISSSDIAVVLIIVLTFAVIIWLIRGGEESKEVKYVGIPIRE